MSSIFLSHSSADNKIAAEIKHRLEQEGHRSIFLDFDPERGIPAGRNWEQELYQQLRSCRVVIVLCSERSMSSKWCFAEITQARSLGKQIFPLKVEPCEVASVLTDRQVIDLDMGLDEADWHRAGRRQPGAASWPWMGDVAGSLRQRQILAAACRHPAKVAARC